MPSHVLKPNTLDDRVCRNDEQPLRGSVLEPYIYYFQFNRSELTYLQNLISTSPQICKGPKSLTMKIWFEKLVHLGALRVGENIPYSLVTLVFSCQWWDQPSRPRLDTHVSNDTRFGHLLPVSVFLGFPDSITPTKASTEGDNHWLFPV